MEEAGYRGKHLTPYTEKRDMRLIVSKGLFIFGNNMKKAEIYK